MGSVCCVAGRPRDLLSNEGGRLGLRESHWQSNVGLSTSTYPHWDVKLQGEDDVTALSSMRLQRTLSSNSGGSRVASSRFYTHQNGNVRNEGSPSDSFRASKWSNSPIHVRNAEDFGSQPGLYTSLKMECLFPCWKCHHAGPFCKGVSSKCFLFPKAIPCPMLGRGLLAHPSLPIPLKCKKRKRKSSSEGRYVKNESVSP